MYKVNGSIDISLDDLKTCIKGSQLLSAALTYERAKQNKTAVTVDESYFIRYAINKAIYDLESSSTFDEN